MSVSSTRCPNDYDQQLRALRQPPSRTGLDVCQDAGILERLGQLLDVRRELGLTQTQLAKQIGAAGKAFV